MGRTYSSGDFMLFRANFFTVNFYFTAAWLDIDVRPILCELYVANRSIREV